MKTEEKRPDFVVFPFFDHYCVHSRHQRGRHTYLTLLKSTNKNSILIGNHIKQCLFFHFKTKEKENSIPSHTSKFDI